MLDKNNIVDYGIFIFRKDLRIEDNKGLILLGEHCKEIIPVFIFDSNQVDLTTKTKNYLSYPALRFISESVKDLNNNIKKTKSNLYVFYGEPVGVLEYIVKQIKKNLNISELAVGFNLDYTEYSLKRDNQIKIFCTENEIQYITCSDDCVLADMNIMLKDSKTPYKQYGAFKKNLLKSKSKFFKPDYKKIKFYKNQIKFTKTLTDQEIDEFWSETGNLNLNYKPVQTGSRAISLKILTKLKDFKDYGTKRDYLSYQTTRLSAYLNFGLISEREFYWGLVDKLGNSTQLINQVIWRDYYFCLLRFLPGANSYSSHIDPRYNKLKWICSIPSKQSIQWIEWDLMMKSKTGFLLVDAAIQELIHTGFMHNRCRMIVGVFGTKYLGINPLCRYIGLNDWFSRYLVDCNTSQNKLNCQWITELDFPGKKFAPSSAPIAGRPMNISNGTIKKWDPDCTYIKKWLPHLANLDNKILLGWDNKYIESIHPKPIFDPKERYQKWIKLCTGI